MQSEAHLDADHGVHVDAGQVAGLDHGDADLEVLGGEAVGRPVVLLNPAAVVKGLCISR